METSEVWRDEKRDRDVPDCFQIATILCHSNCRADKTDLCLPEWVYEKIEAAGVKGGFMTQT